MICVLYIALLSGQARPRRNKDIHARTSYMACTSTYGNCWTSKCCRSLSDHCYQRGSLQYAQCRTQCSTSWITCTQLDVSPPPPPVPPPAAWPPQTPVRWVSTRTKPFGVPFELATGLVDGIARITIAFEGREPEPLHIKGVNWFGFQTDGCVHELYKHTVQAYIDFLVQHRYAARMLKLLLCAQARAPCL